MLPLQGLGWVPSRLSAGRAQIPGTVSPVPVEPLPGAQLCTRLLWGMHVVYSGHPIGMGSWALTYWQPQVRRPLGGLRDEDLAWGGGKLSGEAASERGLEDGGVT